MRGTTELPGLEFHQALRRKADHLAQKNGVRTLLKQFTKGDLVIGVLGEDTQTGGDTTAVTAPPDIGIDAAFELGIPLTARHLWEELGHRPGGA